MSFQHCHDNYNDNDYNDNSNDGDSNNDVVVVFIDMRLEGAVPDFFTWHSLRCELSHACLGGKGAIVCKSHTTH